MKNQWTIFSHLISILNKYTIGNINRLYSHPVVKQQQHLKYCQGLILLFAFLTIPGVAQVQFVEFTGATPSDSATITLTFSIQQGYHIQADQVTENHLIPTQLTLKNLDNLCGLAFPKPETIWLGEGRPLQVFSGLVQIEAQFDSEQAVASGCIQGQLYYQTCDQLRCFFPRVLSFEYFL